MIDEELYKIATDELNSDKRNPEVWARACALACDDHDEARFLYTNLRVEEMMSKGGKSKTFSAAEAKLKAQSLNDDQLNAENNFNLSDAERLDSLDLPPDTGEDAVSSNRTGVDSSNDPIRIDDFVEYESDTDETISSVSGSAQNANPNDALPDVDLDAFAAASDSSNEAIADVQEELSDDTKLDFSEATATLEAGNESMRGAVSSLTGHIIPDDEKPDTMSRMIDPLTGESSEISGSAHMPATRIHTTPETLKTRALSNELERQAKDLGSIDDQIVTPVNYEEIPLDSTNHEALDADSVNNEFDQTATVQYDIAKPDDTAAFDEAAQLAEAESGVQHDYKDPTHILEQQPLAEASALPTRIDGYGRWYLMFNRRNVTKAIKTGVSWPALFFTLPWLLYKQLFGTAIVYALLWVVAIVGLLATGFNWMDAGADATLTTKLWFAGFACLTLLGLFLVPFLYGNSWAADKLERRGFQLQSEVRARSKSEAISKLRQATTTGTF